MKPSDLAACLLLAALVAVVPPRRYLLAVQLPARPLGSPRGVRVFGQSDRAIIARLLGGSAHA